MSQITSVCPSIGSVPSINMRPATGSGLVRIPITQEFMVQAIVADRKGEKSHPAVGHFTEALHESIEVMVQMLAQKYTTTCSEAQEDLAQECMIRVWDKLDLFDPAKGKFTTWVWRVCTSVLSKKYHRAIRRQKAFVAEPEEVLNNMPSNHNHDQIILRNEIADAVRELLDRYPEKRRIILEMFGNPDVSGYIPPPGICIAKCAENIKMPTTEVTYFYRRKVIPFLRRKLKNV